MHGERSLYSRSFLASASIADQIQELIVIIGIVIRSLAKRTSSLKLLFLIELEPDRDSEEKSNREGDTRGEIENPNLFRLHRHGEWCL